MTGWPKFKEQGCETKLSGQDYNSMLGALRGCKAVAPLLEEVDFVSYLVIDAGFCPKKDLID